MANEETKKIDEVSAAYQKLSNEVPPAELDKLILQASKKSLKIEPPIKKSSPYRQYSLAASVCIAVLIVSLTRNNDISVPQAETEVSKVFIESLRESSIRQERVEQLEALDAQFEQDQALRVELNTLARERENTDLSERIESVAESRAQASRLAPAATQSDSIVQTETLEEIVVTSSFVPTFDEDIFEYRNSEDTWLREIQYLLEVDEVSATQEISLFTETYPEIEVESALQALNQ